MDWINSLFDPFDDAAIYFVMGSVGTLLFLIRFALMMFGADGGDDFEVGEDMDAGGHDGGFGLFSMLSIVAFMMGAGWMGLACRTEWNMGPFVSAASASGFGFALMLGTSFAMYQMRKMTEIGGYDVKTCVGKTGRVYLRVPPKGEGHGQVEINVDGRRKVLNAISTADAIESFGSVKVVDVRDDETLIVEPQ